MKTSENLLAMSQSDKCIQLGWTVNYSTFIIQHNKEYNNYTVQLGLFIICSKKKTQNRRWWGLQRQHNCLKKTQAWIPVHQLLEKMPSQPKEYCNSGQVQVPAKDQGVESLDLGGFKFLFSSEIRVFLHSYSSKFAPLKKNKNTTT